MPDAQPDYVPEDLTINDQETVVELVLEQVLDIDNAIAEHDENDEDNAQSFELSKDFKLYTPPANLLAIHPCIDLKPTRIFHKEDSYHNYINEIIPPPPKA